MKLVTLTCAFAAAFAATAAPACAEDNPGDLWLTADQVAADVSLVEEAYSRVHPGYTRYASEAEMHAAWAAIDQRARADGGMRLADLYLAIELALTNIRCDHTKAELPTVMREARLGMPLYLPFRWEMIEGRGVIASAASTVGLARGDEIIAIDGRLLQDMVAEVAPYIPVDGYTDWSRTGGISQSLEFMGGALDHFGMLLWDNDQQAQLLVRAEDGSEREVLVDRISFEAWSSLGGASAANFKDAVQFERIGEDTGLLRIDTFVNYRQPVDPHELLAPIFEAMQTENRSNLILDLRRNGGGSTDAAQALASYLIEEAQPLMRSAQVATLDLSGIRPYLSTWDSRALNPDPRGFIANDDGTYTLRDGIMDDTAVIVPADAAFEGRLLVLTSNENSSGSTNLLTILAQQARTTLIGERTGGSAEGPTAGLLFTLTLPESGIRTRIPLFRFRNNTDTFEPGLGLSPDLGAKMTIADFRAGRDPALDKAMELAATTVDLAVTTGENVQEPFVSIEDFASLEGDTWTGELEYLNYGSDERSIIPVRMVAREPDRRSLSYGFLYPGESHKNAADRLRISRDGRKLNGHTLISRAMGEDGSLILVTEGQGRDDNRPATIRFTYEIKPDRFVVRKDVRFAEGTYINRNEYRLSR